MKEREREIRKRAENAAQSGMKMKGGPTYWVQRYEMDVKYLLRQLQRERHLHGAWREVAEKALGKGSAL